MDLDPTYTLWHPRLKRGRDGKGRVVINVTPGAYDLMPTGPRSFYQQILKEIDIEAEPQEWQVLRYRSNYHGVPDEPATSAERWPINWRLTLTLTKPLDEFPQIESEYFESYAYAGNPEWHQGSGALHCVVIADFKSAAAGRRAQSAVKRALAARALDSETLAQPNFEGFKIGDLFYQLQIDLGPFGDEFFAIGVRLAQEVMEICRRAGGITSFDERAEKWDEL